MPMNFQTRHAKPDGRLASLRRKKDPLCSLWSLGMTVILALGLGSCLEPSHGKNPPTNADAGFSLNGELPNKLRGYEAINTVVRQRLFAKPGNFKLMSYLEEPDESLFASGSSLYRLLGSYDGNGQRQEYQGREPNAMNMLLWQTLFAVFVEDLAKTCLSKEKPSAALKGLDKGFHDSLCAAMATGDTFNADAWEQLWQTSLASDAPEDESHRWLEFVNERINRGVRGSQLLQEALLTMFMNPYFLLVH